MKKFIKSTRGTSLVEFALIAPLLFVLLFGIIEFGAALYNKAVITNASREAARYAATFYTNPANAAAERPSCSEIQTYVVTYVNAYLFNFVTPTPFSTSNVSCPTTTPYNDYGGYTGYVDTIRIDYEYPFLVFGGLMGLLSGGVFSPSLTLTTETVMRDENQNSI